MQALRDFKETVGSTRLWVQYRRSFPVGMCDIMLFSTQTDLFKGNDSTETFIAPRSCHLTANPGVRRLSDNDQPLRILTIQHCVILLIVLNAQSPVVDAVLTEMIFVVI